LVTRPKRKPRPKPAKPKVAPDVEAGEKASLAAALVSQDAVASVQKPVEDLDRPDVEMDEAVVVPKSSHKGRTKAKVSVSTTIHVLIHLTL
jgi:hypothetical protein